MDREHREWLGDHQMTHHKHAGVVRFRRAHKRAVQRDDDDARRRSNEDEANRRRLKDSRELF